jgi:hypothetical protein
MPAVAPVERPSSELVEVVSEEEESASAVPSSFALPVLLGLEVGAGTVADASVDC